VRVSPRPLGGFLALTSLPASAEILLGEIPLGHGSWQGRLPLGRYDLAAREAGYFPNRRSFDAPEARASLSVRVDLRRDPDHPRWPQRSRWRFDLGAQAGAFIAPTLNSGAEQNCPSLCAGSRTAWGGFGNLVFGARHENGLGAEILLGYLGFQQRFSRAVFAPFSVEGEPFVATYALDQTEIGHGPIAELRAKLRRPTRFGVDVWSALGAGLFFANYRAEVEGGAWTSGDAVNVLANPASAKQVSPFVAVALGVEKKVGPIGLRGAFGVWFFPTRGPELGGPVIGVTPACGDGPVVIGCAPQSDALVHERAHGPFLAFTPELAAEYTF